MMMLLFLYIGVGLVLAVISKKHDFRTDAKDFLLFAVTWPAAVTGLAFLSAWEKKADESLLKISARKHSWGFILGVVLGLLFLGVILGHIGDCAGPTDEVEVPVVEEVEE